MKFYLTMTPNKLIFFKFFMFLLFSITFINDTYESVYLIQESEYLKTPKPKPIVLPKNDKIIQALIYVESNGNDSAHNKSENAVGCLQIRPIMIREVNRILKKTNKNERFKMKDRWDREKSLVIFNIWREYHHPNSTNEVIARNWNGGPKGFKKESTLNYWKKVKGRLEINQ